MRTRRWPPWLPSRRWRVIGSVSAADEVPEKLRRRQAVLVQAADAPTWLVFDCPCGRGHRLMLNLVATRRPLWKAADTSKLSVSPSVDSTAEGKRCHFWMRKGRVSWVDDSTPRP